MNYSFTTEFYKIEIPLSLFYKLKFRRVMDNFIFKLAEDCREKGLVFIDTAHSYVRDLPDAQNLPGVIDAAPRIFTGTILAKFDIDNVEWEWKCVDRSKLFFSEVKSDLRNVFLISKGFFAVSNSFTGDDTYSVRRLALSKNENDFELIVMYDTVKIKKVFIPDYFIKVQEGEIFQPGRLTKGAF